MNLRPVLPIVGLAGFVLQAFADPATGPALAAPHPTVLKVKYKNEWVSVIGVIKSDPVISARGKEYRIRQAPVYDTQRTDAFAPGKLQVSGVKLGGVQMYHGSTDFDGEPQVGQYSGLAEFSASVTASRMVERGFVAVVIYSPDIFQRDNPLSRPQVVVWALPPLPVNTAVAIKITSDMFSYVRGQRYFLHFFDDQGREMLTNIVEHAWAYYSQKEAQQLDAAIGRFQDRYAGKDVPATPVVVIRPVIPEGATLPSEPLGAVLRVTPRGRVDQIALTGALDPVVEKAVRAALGGWLFFPRLEAGHPVNTLVQVPLDL